MAEAQTKVRLREYETVFLLKPDVTDDAVDKLKERVRGVVSREGGKVIKFINWGKKKTSFAVAKQPRAIYVEALYLGQKNLVTELERNLRNIDEITKFLTTKVAEEIDPESRPVEPDEKRAGDVEEAPRPERSERRDDFAGGADAEDVAPGVEE
ncbi:MAG: 30S ribosomal protein S6 [Deltaproteobacteria bacterium]|nr:30S ribosomal protein S6 [Deltaproteobacteria bacterium]